MKRIWLPLIIAVVGAGLVFGGGSSEPAANKKVSLTYWTISGGRDKQAAYAIEEFKKTHPNVEVTLVVNSTDDHKKNLKIAASSKSMPSMWFNWGGSLASFYSDNGLVYDLTDYAKKNDWANKYHEAGLKLATLNGVLAGVPAAITMFGAVYRTDLFKKAGIAAEPATFAEFEQALAKLKAAGLIPIATGGKNGWHVFRLIEFLFEKNLGAAKHDQLLAMKTEIWLDEGITKSFSEFKKYVDAGYYPNGFITQEPNDARMLIWNGLAGLTFDGISLVTNAASKNMDVSGYGFFPMPLSAAGNRMTTFITMDQLSNKLNKAELEAALAFQDTLFSQKVVDAMGRVIQHPLAKKEIKIPDDQPLVREMMDALTKQGGFLITDQGLPQEVVTKLFEVQDAVATGKMQPKDVGAAMKVVADNYLATH